MAPNIFKKSVYIIFIISINIVSMVCYYQPIKISHLEGRDKYHLYLDYLNEETKYSEKLNYEEFFNSIFNPEYMFSHHYDNKKIMQSEIKKFCNDDNKFIPFDKYKLMNRIMLFGSAVRQFRECLIKDKIETIDVLKMIYKLSFSKNQKYMKIQQLKQNLAKNQRDELQMCIGNFKKSIKTIIENVDEESYKFDLNEETIGNHIDHLLRITSFGDNYFTYNNTNEKFQYFQYFYKEIILLENKELTGDKLMENITKYNDSEKESCYAYYSQNTIDYYIPMPEIFEGLDDYDDFIKHSEIKIKYLQTLEGPLINNKELYKIYFDHLISKIDYEKLREPIPLPHETMYSVYSLRLQKLGYFPLHEKTWITEMDELLGSPHWNTLFTRHELTKFIENIMKIKDN